MKNSDAYYGNKKRGESIPSLNPAPFGRWTRQSCALASRLAPRYTKMTNSLILAAVILLAWASNTFAQNIEGCFVSRPYKADVHDSFRIRHLTNNVFEVDMHTVGCGYDASPDCSNARFDDLNFKSRFQNGRLTYKEKDSACLIEIAFRNDTVAIVTQVQKCKAFDYWGPHGVYTRENPGEILTACEYEH
jgi:hypothetical protein